MMTTIKAQVEASVLMLASNNILSPANGQPIAVPTQDIVLGCYYLTKDKKDDKFAGRKFASGDEVLLALDAREVSTQTPIKLLFSGDIIDLEHERDDQDVIRGTVRSLKNRVIDTTVGRVIFNEHMPGGMPYVNGTLKKKGLTSLVNYCHLRLGHAETVHRFAQVIHEISRLPVAITRDEKRLDAQEGIACDSFATFYGFEEKRIRRVTSDAHESADRCVQIRQHRAHDGYDIALPRLALKRFE